MQPKQLLPKWGAIHTKKVHEFERETSIEKSKLGDYLMWLHEDT